MVGMVSGRTVLVALLAVVLSAPVGAATSPAGPPGFAPGDPGAGDDYFPRDGNGGYHARHYDLQLSYAPATDRIEGVATMRALATQNLSRFNLDLDGLRVRSVRIDGRKADWDRRAGELVLNPAGRGIRRGHRFVTEVSYAGVPRLLSEPSFGTSGVFHTHDGMVVAGQPHGASTWFPVNDHPSDRATYTFEVTVPSGLEVVANGTLAGRARDGSSTTWTWKARDAMASYLATVDIGDFDLRRYRRGGVRYVDAIDPTLFEPVAEPRTGDRFALSQRADSSYKRLTRTIRVPSGGGRLSFWVDRQTEQDWDFFLVEAHPADSADWTTLPDRNGHTRRDTGSSCPAWLALHPFLERYQAPTRDGGCRARGTTGVWNAATGSSDGYEHWVVNLDRYAGTTVRVSLSQVSDDTFQLYGAYVDDISAPGGAGSTSFEDDGDVMDGWRVTGAPAGSPGNRNDWRIGSGEDTPRPAGAVAVSALGRQSEVIRFLSRRFGPYPFNDAGGIVDAEDRLQFALETQTRPVYSTLFFVNPRFASGVVVHELAHQWYGNSVRIHRWRDIWLNEGFATYAEWLWSKHEGGPGPGQIFRSTYRGIPGNSPFWKVRVADPGPDHIFDPAIYVRGAMTVQQLRERVGDRDFSRILRRWPEVNGGGTGSTREFRRLAERTSGEQLDRLFRVWLHTDRKPVLPGSGAGRPVPRLSAPGATLSRLRAAAGR